MSQTSTYLNQQLFDQFNSALGQADTNAGTGDQYINQFMQSYKNLTGKDATINEIAPFIQNAGITAAALPGNLGYSDLSSLANNYIQQTFPQQVSGHAQQQQTDQLGKTQQTIQDLIGKQTAATAADLTNPNSPTYQSFSGLMNNMGITPSSGAFQAGMGGVLGQSAANAENAALGGVSLPALSGIQGLSGFGLQQAQGQSGLGHLNDMGDFGLQAGLASKLAGSGGGSNMLGNIFAGLNTGANVYSAGKQPTWICTKLKNIGLATQLEVEAVHVRLRPSIFRHPIHWLHYLYNAPRLIALCDQASLDWQPVKAVLIDQVLAEPDPEKAWQIYRGECQRLCEVYAPNLWAFSCEVPQ